MLRFVSSLLVLTGTAILLAGTPANARSNYADDVKFFERVAVGPLDVTPFGIVRDQRCADPRFCYRSEDMRVSVILHDRRIPYEVVLRLGEPAPVPGGYLVLLDPGTRPRYRGALRLSEYALDLEFIPIPRRYYGF